MKEANFKETEIGKIPVDWEVKTLGELGQVIIGLTYSPKDVTDYGTLVLRSSNIQNNVLAFENNVFVNCEVPARVIVKENDILICVRNGSKDLIGKCALIDKKREGVAFGAFMSIFRSDYNLFLINAFRSNIIQKQIDENLGATINQITNKNLKSFQIPLPPLSEQEKIAEVLSDTDLWIESTEALLAKKRQIKKGAMQKLLSPKEDWEVRKLGEVCVFQNGLGHEQFESEFGKYIVVNSKFISTESRVKRFSHKNLVPLQKYDIVIVMSDIPNGKALAKCFYIDKNNLYTLNQRIGRISINDDFDSKFLFYLLNRNKYFLAFDGGSGQTNLRKQEVLDCPIHFPPLKTQQEIAEILSSMDLEIESLENRLQKARQLKQGMMQDLLTGKVRLIEN